MNKSNLGRIVAAVLILGVGAAVFIYFPMRQRAARLAEREADQVEKASQTRGKSVVAEDRSGAVPAKKSGAQANQAAPPHKVQEAALLEDGSFNIIPPKIMTPDSPGAITKNMDWRERYDAALKAVPQTAEKFYVYPFNDETAEGVGVAMTYGAHTSGGAMLAAMTNAALAHDTPPTKWGLPELIHVNSDGIMDREEYEKRVLADTATASVNVFVLGTYSDGKEPNTVNLEAWAIRRDKPSERISLYEGTTTLPAGRIDPKGESFHNLATQQRECIKKIADEVVAKGLAAKREADMTTIPELDKELRELALMLNGNDSQPVMDGINRALGLAALRPDSTAGLQAASYGICMLNSIFFDILEADTHGSDYGMRAYGLAQAALALDARPELSRMMIAANLVMIGHQTRMRYLAFSAGGKAPVVPGELSALQDVVDFARNGLTRAHLAAYQPDWLVMKAEARFRWFLGRPGPFASYIAERVKRADDFDFYSVMKIMTYSKYEFTDMKERWFEAQHLGSALTVRVTIAQEIAALLSAPTEREAPEAIINRLETAMGADLSGLENLARSGDHYGIRRQILNQTRAWGPPESENHPAIAVLKILNEACKSAMRQEANRVKQTSFTGFEFTPAERILLMHRQDARGSLILDTFYSTSFGSYEDTIRVMETYLRVRPESASGWMEYAKLIYPFGSFPDNSARRFDAIRNSHEHRMLEGMTWYWLGRVTYYESKEADGLAILKHFNRFDPFVSERFNHMAEFCSRYGLWNDAAKFMDAYLASHPERYDVRNDRTWALCQMGRWDEEGLNEMFAEPVQKLSGNSSFHDAHLSFLVNWKKDWNAARVAAEKFQRLKGNSGTQWLFRIEREAGNEAEAKRILDSMTPGQLEGLARADFHAEMAGNYSEIGDLNKAADHVAKAAAIDDWKASVIIAMGSLKMRQGDHAGAITEFERHIERYGPGRVEVMIAECLHSMGKTAKAIELLRPTALDKSSHKGNLSHCFALLQIYTDSGDKKNAEAIFDHIVGGSLKYRRDVENACKIYAKLDEKKSKETLARVNEIMAGPAVFFDETPVATLPPGFELKTKK